MPEKRIITTESAPAAIGTYSQAVASGRLVFLSGQIPLDPKTMTLISDDIRTQTEQVFDNLEAVARAAGGGLSDLVKLTVYLLDLGSFQVVNDVMSERFTEPYPARAAIGVAALPKDAEVEVEAVMVLPD
jgi:reactive intermediate/imine deaminase